MKSTRIVWVLLLFLVLSSFAYAFSWQKSFNYYDSRYASIGLILRVDDVNASLQTIGNWSSDKPGILQGIDDNLTAAEGYTDTAVDGLATAQSVLDNITYHEANYAHGNTSDEITGLFSAADGNVSVSSGVIGLVWSAIIDHLSNTFLQAADIVGLATNSNVDDNYTAATAYTDNAIDGLATTASVENNLTAANSYTDTAVNALSGRVDSVNGTVIANNVSITAELALKLDASDQRYNESAKYPSLDTDSTDDVNIGDDQVVTIAGENVTSGTVADARIASTIARDSELIGNCSGDLSCDSTLLYESELNSIAELNTQIADATLLISGGTLTASKWCVYDGAGIDCNVEPVSDTNTWNSTTDMVNAINSTTGTFNINISCSNIVGGSDADYCADGGGSGSGNSSAGWNNNTGVQTQTGLLVNVTDNDVVISSGYKVCLVQNCTHYLMFNTTSNMGTLT